ncbi:glycosyltransferase family 2 protein [Mannheimia indoligenes]|uniref:glycosyltransferase family 2 protein n=1 Tax=Mannheimia indoligenes TaxID=3103145 RepID=UPI002FE5EFA7
MKFTIIIPTYNAGSLWKEWIFTYNTQNLKADKVIVVDSSSTDQTVPLAKQAGFFVHKIAKSDFNHGSTRNLAMQFIEPNTEIVVFMTQDALLAGKNALENLLKLFEDSQVAAVCGRQLPHKDANPLAAHARLFNYPNHSRVKSFADVNDLGIKTAFMSNSFAAYRRSVFEELGGFPSYTILAEDMWLTAKIILAGYKVVYCAEAEVHHSHNYTLKQEFQRYFDTGVFQSCEPWIQKTFGAVGGEGKRFVLSELAFLLRTAPFWIPKSLLSTLCKYIGFKLGLYWRKLPLRLCKMCSMHKAYWDKREK